MDLKYCSPEEKNISSALIKKFCERVQKKGISLHSAIVYADDSIISETYFAPFKKGDLHRMFSVAKSAVAIAVGLLADNGLISLEDHIVDYFPEKLPKNVHPYLAELTICDMLMMRTCHAQTTYNKFDLSSDWVGSFFTTVPTHKPGTIFHYDTSAPHVLSALVEKLTGKQTWDYIRDSLPELGLSDKSYLIKDGQGISFGGSGLVATTEDILRLGIFFLNEGCIDGRQLISREFCHTAVSDLTPNCVASQLPSESCGYGYYVWCTERAGYVLYGMGGQLVIICPKERIILVSTADTQGYAGGNQVIYDAFYEEVIDKIGTVSPNSSDFEDLKAYSATACMNTVLSTVRGARIPDNDELIDSEYTLSDNASGFTSLGILIKKDGGSLTFGTSDGLKYIVHFGIDINKEGTLPLYGDRTCGSGAYIGKDTFYILLRVIGERVGSVHFELYFEEKEIIVFVKKIEETGFNEFNAHLHGVLR